MDAVRIDVAVQPDAVSDDSRVRRRYVVIGLRGPLYRACGRRGRLFEVSGLRLSDCEGVELRGRRRSNLFRESDGTRQEVDRARNIGPCVGPHARRPQPRRGTGREDGRVFWVRPRFDEVAVRLLEVTTVSSNSAIRSSTASSRHEPNLSCISARNRFGADAYDV